MEMNDDIDGKREFFRVDDVFPVLVKKIAAEERGRRSRLVSLKGTPPPQPEVPDASFSPQAWKLLLDINAKLDFILEKTYLESEGLTQATGMPVTISASGVRLELSEIFSVGEIAEIKMSLPMYPPAVIVAIGEVVRVAALKNGRTDVAFRFINMEEDVRDVIIQYTFKRQREVKRKE